MVQDSRNNQICDNDNGIVTCNMNGEEYTFWTLADFIKDEYIINFLKERFPSKLIARELNMIDFTIPEENLPIEVQSTIVVYKGGNSNPVYSRFEKDIEKQINQNIVSYGMCWFFFDSELLRAMKNASRGISINMVWFRNYMKEGKLKVFTVSHNGIIEEKEYKDFDFLAKISQTCIMSAETDYMILNNNKMKIFANVAKGHGFIQEEIDKFYDGWRKYCELNEINNADKNDRFTKFLVKQKDKRSTLYGNILHAVNNLPAINNMLGLKDYGFRAVKFYASILGIFDVDGWSKNSTTRFVDRFDVCQYIPGCTRKKETWDKLKGHNLNNRQFENIIKNGIDNYFWYEEDEIVAKESEQISDKDVNVTIESKDQIITINIKKTKQINIDEAWE